MSRNSRNGESAKNRISEFSPNSPFSSKLPFPRAPLPSHLPWKLYFGEFLPYSSNWPLSSKSLLWTAPLCHIIWLAHITMANLRYFHSFRQCSIFVDSFPRQSFTLDVISKLKLSALKLAIMAYFFHVVVICQEYFFSQFYKFQTRWIFYPWSWL